MLDPIKLDIIVLNRKSIRILNLAAISLLLLLAKDVYKAKVIATKLTPKHSNNKVIKDIDNNSSNSNSNKSSTNNSLSNFNTSNTNLNSSKLLKHYNK